MNSSLNNVGENHMNVSLTDLGNMKNKGLSFAWGRMRLIRLPFSLVQVPVFQLERRRFPGSWGIHSRLALMEQFQAHNEALSFLLLLGIILCTVFRDTHDPHYAASRVEMKRWNIQIYNIIRIWVCLCSHGVDYALEIYMNQLPRLNDIPRNNTLSLLPCRRSWGKLLLLTVTASYMFGCGKKINFRNDSE